jgi:hypothetical protein
MYEQAKDGKAALLSEGSKCINGIYRFHAFNIMKTLAGIQVGRGATYRLQLKLRASQPKLRADFFSWQGFLAILLRSSPRILSNRCFWIFESVLRFLSQPLAPTIGIFADSAQIYRGAHQRFD